MRFLIRCEDGINSIVLGLAASLDLEEQMDVKTAFSCLFYERTWGQQTDRLAHTDFPYRGAQEVAYSQKINNIEKVLNAGLTWISKVVLSVRFLSNPGKSIGKMLNGELDIAEACKNYCGEKVFGKNLVFKQQRYAVLLQSIDAIEDGMFELNKVHTDDNASDMLTKAVAREKLKVDGHNMSSLDTVQRALDANPMDTNLKDEEAVYLNAFNEAKLDRERFLKQKAKWMDGGWDSNSLIFIKTVAGALVPEVFVNHYEEFLGNHSICDDLNIDGLFHSKVSDQSCLSMVAWEVICLPKNEGGLRIRNLYVLNVALMTTHIWNIISHKDSLWVSWIHPYKLQGRSFWEVPIVADSTWGWRKLLQLRELVNLLFSPLANLLTPRDISNRGFNMNSCVSDLVVNGQWMWPQAWLLKAPNLSTIPTPNIDPSKHDMVLWHDLDGNLLVFSVRNAWEALRLHGNEILWSRVVWFPHGIPRHAFHLWLVLHGSLRTQDKLWQWDVGESTDLSLLHCPLCNLIPDSHKHLFFACSFSSQVWHYVRSMADMDLLPPTLHQINLKFRGEIGGLAKFHMKIRKDELVKVLELRKMVAELQL
ncbi:homeodomain-like protein [Tanacetum coccineum]